MDMNKGGACRTHLRHTYFVQYSYFLMHAQISNWRS